MSGPSEGRDREEGSRALAVRDSAHSRDHAIGKDGQDMSPGNREQGGAIVEQARHGQSFLFLSLPSNLIQVNQTRSRAQQLPRLAQCLSTSSGSAPHGPPPLSLAPLRSRAAAEEPRPIFYVSGSADTSAGRADLCGHSCQRCFLMSRRMRCNDKRMRRRN